MRHHDHESLLTFTEPERPLGRIGITGSEEVLDGERNNMDMEYSVEKIVDGLGFGDGTISRAEVEENAGAEMVRRVDALITSPQILVDVDKDASGNAIDDDGCGDGRIAGLIRKGRGTLDKISNSIRAKVFGGGSAMATADIIGAGNAADSLNETFQQGIDQLADKGIGFGAHEDTHAHGSNCGCGAIDKAPQVVAAVGAHSEMIRDVFGTLGLEGDHLDSIFKNYADFAAATADQEYRGADVMDAVADKGKIIKRLEGTHIEARIILNLVQGKTVNQQLVHEVSDGKMDVFAVDVWRLQNLAARLHPEDEDAQRRAFQGMVVYTLAVAAVLTKGDLPVYLVKPAA